MTVEGAAYDASLVCGKDKQSKIDVNTTAISAERKNGIDMRFKLFGVIRHSSLVENEPVKSADHSLDEPNKFYKVRRCL